MLQVSCFTFNPFSENTYVVSAENKECIIFDPGMYQASEEMQIQNYIRQAGLKPVYLINTHCHIDHIFGNTFISETYQLPLHIHELEKQVLSMGKTSASLYGLKYHPSVEAGGFLTENDKIRLGENELSILFTPGHSPGSISFYSSKDKFLISGDVLFKNSIGRSDLPGGNFETLMHSIHTCLLPLPEDTIVYSGHGPSTSIGEEKQNNPYLQNRI